MSRETDFSFFCKRCRATQVKRCRCPLPILGQNHDWSADAVFNLWPNHVKAEPAVASRWDGNAISLSELLDRSHS
jgi:hypothetical protein